MLEGFPGRNTRPGVAEHTLRILGTGAANPTLQTLQGGLVVTRTGVGTYLITWLPSTDKLGSFDSWSPGFGSLTMVDLAGYTAVRGVYNSTARTLAFTVLNGANAAADLAANQYLDFSIRFQTEGA